MIVSKRHPWKYYGYLLLLFLVIVGLIALFAAVAILGGKQNATMKVIFLLVGISLLIYLFYVARLYFKNAPIIRLDETTISFGEKETYQLSKIEDIEFTGVISFGDYLWYDRYTEGVTITFENGTKQYIFDDMYENTWQIKMYLQKVVLHKEEHIATELKEISNVLKRENIEIFKDHQLTSFAGILLWGFLAFIIGLLVLDGSVPDTIAILPIVGFWMFFFMLNSFVMFYFGVSQNYLIVKNHNFFWFTNVYRLENILEVVHEEHINKNYRWPYFYALRITTRDFKSKLYRAGTLKNKTWGKLMSRLEKEGIEVKYVRL